MGANDGAAFRTRAIAIKEQRADLVKHHLDVLWHDYFKPEHLETVPNLHELFWNATKQVSKVKASTDIADAKKLLDLIDEVDAAWKATGGNEKTRVAGGPPDLTLARRGPMRPPVPPRAVGGAPHVAAARVPRDAAPGRGPWRVAVADGSMLPAIQPGDWLLVNPRPGRWPRRGPVVVFREPIGRAGDQARGGPPRRRGPVRGGRLRLQGDEAWLLGDASDDAAIQAGEGRPVDSRRYGPVGVDRLVGRVWLRYWPWRRAGRIQAGPPVETLLARGRTAPGPPPTAYGPVDLEALLAADREGGARRAATLIRSAMAAVPPRGMLALGALRHRRRRIRSAAMDALIAELPSFDPERELPGPPEPWASTEMPALRDGPPYLMTESIAAEPALAERLVARLEQSSAVDGLARLLRTTAMRGEPVVVTGCGTSEHAALGVVEIPSGRLADGQAPGAGWCRRRAGGGAGVRAVAGFRRRAAWSSACRTRAARPPRTRRWRRRARRVRGPR